MAKKKEEIQTENVSNLVNRDVAMDVLKVHQEHRLFISKRHKAEEELVIDEWEAIFKKYGLIYPI